MNRKINGLSLFLVILVAVLTPNCSKEKSESSSSGNYSSTATNKANSADVKPLSLTIISTANPVAGTYKLAGTSGKVSGSVLGLIYDLILSPMPLELPTSLAQLPMITIRV